MIAFIEGEVISLSQTSAVIKVSGLGYKVTLCKEDLLSLSVGQKIELFVHTNVREDALELYGFKTNAQKELFLLLISISGVGPKLGINIASYFPQNELVGAILEKDIAKLSSIPGIGKKTAERISLELKDKVTKLEFQPTGPVVGEVPLLISLQQAIRNLGFSKDQFNKAIMSIDEHELSNLSLEDLIKKTLSTLSGAKAS